MAPVSFVGVASGWARPIGMSRGGTLTPSSPSTLGRGFLEFAPFVGREWNYWVWERPIAASLSRAVALATRGAAWERSRETDPWLRLPRCSCDLQGSEAG